MQSRRLLTPRSNQYYLSDTTIGKFLQKMSSPVISEFLILTAIILLWYEGLFAKTGPGFLNSIYLVPSLTLFAFLTADKSKIKITKSFKLLVTFFLFALISNIGAASRNISPLLIISGWLLFSQFLFAVLIGQGVSRPYRLLQNIVFVSIPMMLAGGYQYLTKQATSQLWVTPAEMSVTTRAFAFFGSPNILGNVLVLIIFISAGLYFSKKGIYFGLISLGAFAVTVFTFSRSAWLGLLVTCILIVLLKQSKAAILLGLAPLGWLIPQIRDRLSVVFSPGYWLDSSLDGRLWAVNNGIHIWSRYPLFGTGTGTYGGRLALGYASPVYLEGIQRGYVALYFTDNQWLQLLVQTGVIGLIIFSLFMVNIFLELFEVIDKSRDWVPLCITGAFLSFLIAGLFGNVLEFGAIAIPMGIMIGVVSGEA